MGRSVSLLALVALVPAMTGPVAAVEWRREAALALCGGGAVSIPLGGMPGPAEGNAPCCAKGCRSGQSRKRSDRAA